jgi:hypothetical protein
MFLTLHLTDLLLKNLMFLMNLKLPKHLMHQYFHLHPKNLMYHLNPMFQSRLNHLHLG